MVLFSNKPPLEHRLNKPSPFYSSGQEWDSHSLSKLGCIPSTVSWHWAIVIPTIDYCYNKKKVLRDKEGGGGNISLPEELVNMCTVLYHPFIC